VSESYGLVFVPLVHNYLLTEGCCWYNGKQATLLDLVLRSFG
jgi:hypothetical protein